MSSKVTGDIRRLVRAVLQTLWTVLWKVLRPCMSLVNDCIDVDRVHCRLSLNGGSTMIT